ncbi:hypothetical protein HPP92_021041 [Vanilla planifolia]|uniref:SBP-type domain-containing protein n=1 Tax=Vanilla planifolia TaxID=51239 RepID=A0A835UJ21_VANPL|nr:hypothetical protein HPP92_021041 [Vanilla planifolia]
MPGGGSQNVSCLVDGCRSDLSNCREYHRRHKVCEVHSKTPIVLVGGQEQRFCQQCSRFHLLAEFDDVKRSCRKRLDGHNRRRRKPQIDPINPGNLYPSSHGTGFTSYPQTFPASADTTWISIGAGAEDTRYGQNPLSMHFLDRVQPFSGTMGIKEGKQFPFLHSSEGMAIGCRTTVEQTAVCQPLLKTFSPAEAVEARQCSQKDYLLSSAPTVLSLSVILDSDSRDQSGKYGNSGEDSHWATSAPQPAVWCATPICTNASGIGEHRGFYG